MKPTIRVKHITLGVEHLPFRKAEPQKVRLHAIPTSPLGYRRDAKAKGSAVGSDPPGDWGGSGFLRRSLKVAGAQEAPSLT